MHFPFEEGRRCLCRKRCLDHSNCQTTRGRCPESLSKIGSVSLCPYWCLSLRERSTLSHGEPGPQSFPALPGKMSAFSLSQVEGGWYTLCIQCLDILAGCCCSGPSNAIPPSHLFPGSGHDDTAFCTQRLCFWLNGRCRVHPNHFACLSFLELAILWIVRLSALSRSM